MVLLIAEEKLVEACLDLVLWRFQDVAEEDDIRVGRFAVVVGIPNSQDQFLPFEKLLAWSMAPYIVDPGVLK